MVLIFINLAVCSIYCLISSAIVYNAASIAVVYNKGAGKQQFLKGAHTDEVIGIAAHPAGQIFATGEAGRKPSIIVWFVYIICCMVVVNVASYYYYCYYCTRNSKEMQVLSRIHGSHERGVPLLAFNSNGKVLASIGLDGNSTLCLHEWLKGVEILRTPTNKGKVLALCFLENDAAESIDTISTLSPSRFTASVNNGPNIRLDRDIVVTAGERHLQFWWTQGQNVQSQRALWGKYRKAKRSTIMCVASGSSGICVTGSANGGIMIWDKFRVSFAYYFTFYLHFMY